MKKCERCGTLVDRRTRCEACKRLCCTGCLDWSAKNDFGRAGAVVCDGMFYGPGKMPILGEARSRYDCETPKTK